MLNGRVARICASFMETIARAGSTGYHRDMVEEHDQLIIRCRRLGHEVPFRFCRLEGGDCPCRLILDCWWERFDVRAFLQEHLCADLMESLEQEKPFPNKTASIADLIEQAKRRLNKD
ncbi:hypothetical protein HQ520_18315 [bacterium]|nr:hypothetical protein [bacterium]